MRFRFVLALILVFACLIVIGRADNWTELNAGLFVLACSAYIMLAPEMKENSREQRQDDRHPEPSDEPRTAHEACVGETSAGDREAGIPAIPAEEVKPPPFICKPCRQSDHEACNGGCSCPSCSDEYWDAAGQDSYEDDPEISEAQAFWDMFEDPRDIDLDRDR